jgi:hypothetical protein
MPLWCPSVSAACLLPLGMDQECDLVTIPTQPFFHSQLLPGLRRPVLAVAIAESRLGFLVHLKSGEAWVSLLSFRDSVTLAMHDVRGSGPQGDFVLGANAFHWALGKEAWFPQQESMAGVNQASRFAFPLDPCSYPVRPSLCLPEGSHDLGGRWGRETQQGYQGSRVWKWGLQLQLF